MRRLAVALLAFVALSAGASLPAGAQYGGSFNLSTYVAEPGQSVTATSVGHPCKKNAPVQVYLGATLVASGHASATGAFSIPFTVPTTTTPGMYTVKVVCGSVVMTRKLKVVPKGTGCGDNGGGDHGGGGDQGGGGDHGTTTTRPTTTTTRPTTTTTSRTTTTTTTTPKTTTTQKHDRSAQVAASGAVPVLLISATSAGDKPTTTTTTVPKTTTTTTTTTVPKTTTTVRPTTTTTTTTTTAPKTTTTTSPCTNSDDGKNHDSNVEGNYRDVSFGGRGALSASHGGSGDVALRAGVLVLVCAGLIVLSLGKQRAARRRSAEG